MWEIGQDVQALIDCFIKLGLEWDGTIFKGGELSEPSGTLDCKNSGTALRFLIGQSSTCTFPISLDGDASLRTRSSLQLLKSLELVDIVDEEHQYPISINGPMEKTIVEIDVSKTSQFYSSLLLMAPRTKGFQIMAKGRAVSRKHSELTWDLCKKTGAKEPGKPWLVDCPDVEIPPDASMMAFAKLSGLRVSNQPEESDSIGHSMENSMLRDSNDLITPMAAWLALGEGGTITGAHHATLKESNRIIKTVEMLSQFGITSTASTDGIKLEGGQVPRRPESIVKTYGDHRIQMTAIILASICGGTVEGASLHQVAWPSYLQQLKNCGLRFEIIQP
jgi:3-phosphoshikimate 1-carboxyvinyltransferase